MKLDGLSVLHEYDEAIGIFLAATDGALAARLFCIEEFDACSGDGFSVGAYYASPFAGFHPSVVRMVRKEDDYYLRARADHHVLLYGLSEGIDSEDALYVCTPCVVHIANHKGGIHIGVYLFRQTSARGGRD